MSAQLCHHCGAPLTALCMACRGRVGGAAKTPAKRAAAQANARKPRPQARKGKDQE